MRFATQVLICALSVSCGAAAQSAKLPLDSANFVVIGDGLAAGQADFGLTELSQRYSFPNLMAQQMGTIFPQPLLQGPGLHDVLGEPAQQLFPPFLGTGAVRVQLRARPDAAPAPPLFVFNLSVPNARLSDALARRPAHPLIHEFDRRQTALNLLLGFPQLLFESDVPLWTQLEYAEAMNPTLALVQLGYVDLLEAAARGAPLPGPDAFRREYDQVVSRLRARLAEVIVTTIPDPFDTAYFSTPAFAASFTRTPLPDLLSRFALREDDLLTRQGLIEAGYRLMIGSSGPLPLEHVIQASAAQTVRARTSAYNQEIAAIAREHGAVVYDLNALFRRVRTEGVAVGSVRLTAGYFGRFYSMDGIHPGRTGHAIVANELLALLNRSYGTTFPLVDAAAIFSGDPTAAHLPISPERSAR